MSDLDDKDFAIKQPYLQRIAQLEQQLLERDALILKLQRDGDFPTELLPNANFGHDGKPWPQTMDAKIWADEFCKRNSASDQGTILGWFANALMVGYDTAQRDKEITK